MDALTQPVIIENNRSLTLKYGQDPDQCDVNP